MAMTPASPFGSWRGRRRSRSAARIVESVVGLEEAQVVLGHHLRDPVGETGLCGEVSSTGIDGVSPYVAALDAKITLRVSAFTAASRTLSMPTTLTPASSFGSREPIATECWAA